MCMEEIALHRPEDDCGYFSSLILIQVSDVTETLGGIWNFFHAHSRKVTKLLTGINYELTLLALQKQK